MAVHPSLSGYTEVPLCRMCSTEATREYGLETVSLFEARAVSERHDLAMERRAFFSAFVGTSTTQEVIVAA